MGHIQIVWRGALQFGCDWGHVGLVECARLTAGGEAAMHDLPPSALPPLQS